MNWLFYKIWNLEHLVFCLRINNCSSTVHWKVPFLHWIFAFAKNSWSCLCGFVSELSIMLHWSVCLSLHPFLINIAKVGRTEISTLFFFFKIIATILVSFPFHKNFYLQKNLAGIFDTHCIKHVYQFGENWHLHCVEHFNPQI